MSSTSSYRTDDEFVEMNSSSADSDMTQEDFRIICQKATKLAQVNAQALRSIEEQIDKTVITGYEYNINTTDPQENSSADCSSEDNKPRPFIITKTKTHKVIDLIASWRYKGEPLQVENIFGSNVFGFTIDFSLITYHDVKRMVKITNEMVDKYVHFFCNNADTRLGLQTIVNNLELLQAALREIHDLTIDVVDKKKELRKAFAQICGDKMIIQSSSLCIESLHMRGIKSDLFTNSFKASSWTSLTQTLNVHESSVQYLDSCIYKRKLCLLTGTIDGSIKIWNTSNYTLEKTHREPNFIYSLCVYTNKGLHCLAVGHRNKINLYNLTDFSAIASLHHKGKICALKTFYQQDDDKTFLVSAGSGNFLNVWDLDTHKIVTFLKTRYGPICKINVFDQDGVNYIVAAGNGAVEIWKPSEEKLVALLQCRCSLFRTLDSFKYNGKVILACGADEYKIRLWAMSDYSFIGDLEGHSDEIRALSFAPCDDKLHLVSGSNDMTIRIWDVEDQLELRRIRCTVPVSSLHHYNDGNESSMVVGNQEGRLQTTTVIILN